MRDVKTVRDILPLSRSYVAAEANGRPNHEIELLFVHVLRLRSRLELYLKYDVPVSSDELVRLRSGVKRLASGEPLAYIIGQVEFYGFPFSVSPSVLIPRPETEEVVSQALAWLNSDERNSIEGSSSAHRSFRCLDLCCGSGCIGLSIKKKYPNLCLDLVDICPEALQVAEANRLSLAVDAVCIRSDLFDLLEAVEPYDLIVSNPPYISQKEYDGLDSSVKSYEPKRALVGGADGLEIYRRIAQRLRAHLKPGGCFICEIGAAQKDEVEHVFGQFGFSPFLVKKDIHGFDRVLVYKEDPSA